MRFHFFSSFCYLQIGKKDSESGVESWNIGETEQPPEAIVKQEHLLDSLDHSDFNTQSRIKLLDTETSEEFQYGRKGRNLDPEFLNALLTKHKSGVSSSSRKVGRKQKSVDTDLAPMELGVTSFNPATYARGDGLYKKYEPHEKLQVLAYAKKYNNMRASRFFGIGESTIRCWAKAKMRILAKIHKQNLEGPKGKEFTDSLDDIVGHNVSDTSSGDVN